MLDYEFNYQLKNYSPHNRNTMLNAYLISMEKNSIGSVIQVLKKIRKRGKKKSKEAR